LSKYNELDAEFKKDTLTDPKEKEERLRLMRMLNSRSYREASSVERKCLYDILSGMIMTSLELFNTGSPT
jgi:hypothetical protein